MTDWGLSEANAIKDIGAVVGAESHVAAVLSVSQIDDWTRGVVGRLGKDARKEQRTRGERVVRETHGVWSVRGNEDVGTEWLPENQAFEWRIYTYT